MKKIKQLHVFVLLLAAMIMFKECSRAIIWEAVYGNLSGPVQLSNDTKEYEGNDEFYGLGFCILKRSEILIRQSVYDIDRAVLVGGEYVRTKHKGTEWTLNYACNSVPKSNVNMYAKVHIGLGMRFEDGAASPVPLYTLGFVGGRRLFGGFYLFFGFDFKYIFDGVGNSIYFGFSSGPQNKYLKEAIKEYKAHR